MEPNLQSLPLFTTQTLSRSRPEVIIPSPRMLNLNPEDFLPRKTRGCKTSNAFIIYRKIYVKILLEKELHSKMTEASRWASEAWSVERVELKDEYREFAKKVSKIYRRRAQELDASRTPPRILPSRSPPDNTNNNNNNNNIDIDININNTMNDTIENIQPNKTLVCPTQPQQILSIESFDANYQEQLQPLPNPPSYIEPLDLFIYYPPSFNPCEICNFPFECICMSPWIHNMQPTFDSTFLQDINDDEFNLNMDDFSM